MRVQDSEESSRVEVKTTSQTNLWRRRDGWRPWGETRRNMEDLSAWRWVAAGRWRDWWSWMRRRRHCQVDSLLTVENENKEVRLWRSGEVIRLTERRRRVWNSRRRRSTDSTRLNIHTRCITGEIWSVFLLQPPSALQLNPSDADQTRTWYERGGDATGEKVSDAAGNRIQPLLWFSAVASQLQIHQRKLFLSVQLLRSQTRTSHLFCTGSVSGCWWGSVTFSPGSERRVSLF